MTDTDTSEYTVSQPRVCTMKGFRHFYVSGQASMATIAPVCMELIDKVVKAYLSLHPGSVQHPQVILTYNSPDETGEFAIKAGFAVPAGTEAAAGARVEDVDDYRCASLLLVGKLSHLSAAYGALSTFVRERKDLRSVGVYREWYLYWEDGDGDNNVTMITDKLA